ncbi:MAG: 16S rRNA (cytosine(1402)-N(4))-methyltransferase RsmH [Actinobacteria bacterium]|nr:16S rRNA (cytosine(1402)-N(4))-methyltransferase RsmH [Actinomycetota bacterium]
MAVAPFVHEPVMLDTVAVLLARVPGGTYLDLTLGGGGHASALLAAHPGLRLVGIDRDPEAIAAASERLAPFADRVVLRHARSDQLTDVLRDLDRHDVTAVLADLGVSSPQVDRAHRGFSYRDDVDGPLDMRMDPTGGPSAAELLDAVDEAELVRILQELGDERNARRIARAITAARPIGTTGALARVVRDATPAPARRRGGDPAKRTFQALRMAVNEELGILARTLDQAISVLQPGGRAVVLAYHSGEDRLVKERFRAAADGGCTCPPGLPCVCGAMPVARLLRRGALKPGAAEVAANPRARSARLRALEKTVRSPEGSST